MAGFSFGRRFGITSVLAVITIFNRNFGVFSGNGNTAPVIVFHCIGSLFRTGHIHYGIGNGNAVPAIVSNFGIFEYAFAALGKSNSCAFIFRGGKAFNHCLALVAGNRYTVLSVTLCCGAGNFYLRISGNSNSMFLIAFSNHIGNRSDFSFFISCQSVLLVRRESSRRQFVYGYSPGCHSGSSVGRNGATLNGRNHRSASGINAAAAVITDGTAFYKGDCAVSNPDAVPLTILYRTVFQGNIFAGIEYESALCLVPAVPGSSFHRNIRSVSSGYRPQHGVYVCGSVDGGSRCYNIYIGYQADSLVPFISTRRNDNGGHFCGSALFHIFQSSLQNCRCICVLYRIQCNRIGAFHISHDLHISFRKSGNLLHFQRLLCLLHGFRCCFRFCLLRHYHIFQVCCFLNSCFRFCCFSRNF